MGFKKVLPPQHLITDGVMTGTSVITSPTIDKTNLDNVGIHIIWTGSAVGTVEIKCSIFNVVFDAITFNPVLTQPAGTAGSYLIDLNQIPFPYIKVVYTNTSGTGVLNVHLCGGDVN